MPNKTLRPSTIQKMQKATESQPAPQPQRQEDPKPVMQSQQNPMLVPAPVQEIRYDPPQPREVTPAQNYVPPQVQRQEEPVERVNIHGNLDMQRIENLTKSIMYRDADKMKKK